MKLKKIVASIMAIAAITASLSAPAGAIQLATCYREIKDASDWSWSGTRVGIVKFGNEEKCATLYGRFNWNVITDSAASKLVPFSAGWQDNYYHDAHITTEIDGELYSKYSGDVKADTAHSGWCALDSSDWARARGFVTRY